MVRYRREDEAIADELKATRRGVRDVQRPTGTERAQTAAAVVDLSDAVDAIVDDLVPPWTVDAPTTPTVTSARGVIRVASDGMLATDPPAAVPQWITHLLVELSVDGGATFLTAGAMPRGAWVASINSVPVGSSALLRLRLLDRLGRVSEASSTVEVVVVGVSGPDLEANSVSTNHLVAGSVTVDVLAPGVGSEIVLAGNLSIQTLESANAATQADTDGNAAALAQLRQRYDFTEDELLISQVGSPFQLGIDNERLEFRESGVARAWLSAGQWHAESIVSGQLVMGNHLIEADGTGLVFRRLT